ncbi:MAG: LCP family protein, partial [Rudaea sp.]
TTSDFDRSKRQMQIIMACREKALKLNMLPQFPQLWSDLQNTVHTDLTLNQMLALAPYGTQIRSDNIKSRSIDESMTMEIRLNNGADVLWPDRSKISAVVNEMFRTAVAPAAAEVTPKPENAKVAVLNGSGKSGYADQAARYLRSRGLNVVQVGNAQRSDYRSSVIVLSGDLPQTVAAISEALNVQPANVQQAQTPSGIDVQVIVGADWVPPPQ